jgi:CheY-like chemotaxis protein
VTSDMAFECLLISRDPAVVCVMNRLLDDFSISTKVCLNTSEAFDQLAGRNTDLVIVDWNEESAELLTGIRKSNGWRKPTVVAVSPNDCTLRGADIVLSKPVTDKSGARSLKAAYSRMLYDHRRHTRYALMSKVMATDERGRSIEVTILDIGDGGIGISTKEQFIVGDVLCLRLLLPGADRTIYIQARVQWTREYGALGCEFLRIPPVDLNILHDWLRSKNQIKKPVISL